MQTAEQVRAIARDISPNAVPAVDPSLAKGDVMEARIILFGYLEGIRESHPNGHDHAYWREFYDRLGFSPRQVQLLRKVANAEENRLSGRA